MLPQVCGTTDHANFAEPLQALVIGQLTGGKRADIGMSGEIKGSAMHHLRASMRYTAHGCRHADCDSRLAKLWKAGGGATAAEKVLQMGFGGIERFQVQQEISFPSQGIPGEVEMGIDDGTHRTTNLVVGKLPERCLLCSVMEEGITEQQLLQIRRDKLQGLRDKGGNPFGGKFGTTHSPGQLKGDFQEELEVAVAGRIVAHRDMGKSHFFDIADAEGRIQCFLNAKAVGEEAFEIFKLLDLGDWVGINGVTFNTKKGEPSVKVKEMTVLSKSLRPMPDKFKGLVDKEIRYRQRYLDLMSNESSRKIFLKRIHMISEMRRFLGDRGFLEVETPMLQPVAGGAAASPFKTHHNALNMPLFMRIAPELFLKRLLVGGFTKVFELNRSFRNEGISRRHNPEFTMLEAYWAYADFEIMADLVEEMICHLAEKFCGGLQIEHKNEDGEHIRTINLGRPWRRASYRDLIREIDPEWFNYSAEKRRERCGELKVEISPDMEDYEVTQQVFEKLIEEKLFDPCYVTHVPKELVPLAKQNTDDDTIVDVYELIINGQEISPGYSELNDPIVQRQRLEEQAGEEIQNIDGEFITALEHGMPSAGGIGIGIDRLVMMLTGAENIRDVIFFPHMRNRE